MTLYELNHLVRAALESTLDEEYWVQGELSDASAGYGGHFYGELVQKDAQGESIVARARVNCWARTYNILRMRLYRETGQTLRAGMQVKLLVRVTFHEQYGYALSIQDIDSTFTLGDLARRRREILAQLEADGILHDNQQLPLPRLLNRIAVVSSERAAGYGDFCNQLSGNDYGFRFEVKLFPAVMQGEQVPESIIAALEAISASPSGEGRGEPAFDVVVIIRGGGATGDLSDFDSYPLAACIAQFPLPVITGIGHERDETVLDHVAHTRVKTPTAAAAFIIDHQAQEAALLDNLQQRLAHATREHISHSRQRMERLGAVLPLLFARYREHEEHRLGDCRRRLATSLAQYFQSARHRHELLAQRLTTADPQQMLRRGYSITWCDGRLLRSAADAPPGSELRTMLENGELKSIVK